MRPATAEDVPASADLLARAFEHDPLWAALMPRADHRVRNIRWLMQADLAGAGVRSLDVAVDEGGRIVGALRFTAPRSDAPRPWWQRAAGQAGWRLGNLLGGSLGRGLQQERAVRAHRPRAPHWYLQEVAADPARQGQGIGSALLVYRLARIDQTHNHPRAQTPAPTALEATTADSARLYARHGFTTVGTVDLLPGTRSQVMVRPASTQTQPAAPEGDGRA